jgi:hypothetical protein
MRRGDPTAELQFSQYQKTGLKGLMFCPTPRQLSLKLHFPSIHLS